MSQILVRPGIGKSQANFRLKYTNTLYDVAAVLHLFSSPVIRANFESVISFVAGDLFSNKTSFILGN